jgi:hypothetical protein
MWFPKDELDMAFEAEALAMLQHRSEQARKEKEYNPQALMPGFRGSSTRITPPEHEQVSIKIKKETIPVATRPAVVSFAEFAKARREAEQALYQGSLSAVYAASQKSVEAALGNHKAQLPLEFYARLDYDVATRVAMEVQQTYVVAGWRCTYSISERDGRSGNVDVNFKLDRPENG